MTKQDAIETIRMAIAQVEWEYPMDYAAAFDMAIEALNQPEIVRCQDCKHGYKCEFDIRCENKNMPPMFGQHFSYNWFCADGERKSADEN